jgi:hypothetical protein
MKKNFRRLCRKEKAMECQLYGEDETCLNPREIARRFVSAMPATQIDWNKGNAVVEEQRKVLVARRATSVILASHA